MWCPERLWIWCWPDDCSWATRTGICGGRWPNFPLPGVADRVLDRYFIEGGKAADAPFRPIPMASPQPTREHLELTVIANFVEVYLAREGHDGLVGINFLEKIQLPTLPSLFGAMLAGWTTC